MPYTYKVGEKLIPVPIEEMDESHKVVLSLISFEAPKRDSKRITQRQIMEHEKWLGCHPQHEASLAIPDKTESTLRQIRQIIRDLRLNYGCPILSDVKGYWVPETQGEVEEALQRIEAVAKSQAKAWFETYRELSTVFETQQISFFERQRELLDEGSQ